MVRNVHGHLVHETLKSAVSKELLYEFSNFWLEQHRTLYL